MTATLFNYWRSSASYRVRIALALVGVTYDHIAVNLAPGMDEQLTDAYQAINPQRRVPFFRDGTVELSQSLAIMEYLNETVDGATLLPSDPVERARVRQIAHIVAMDMQPVQNLSVLKQLKLQFGASQDDVNTWVRDFLALGLAAIEDLLTKTPHTSVYCFGDTPSLADVCLVPQLYNAERFNVDLTSFPTIVKVCEGARAHPAFVAAHPENQPDAPAS